MISPYHSALASNSNILPTVFLNDFQKPDASFQDHSHLNVSEGQSNWLVLNFLLLDMILDVGES